MSQNKFKDAERIKCDCDPNDLLKKEQQYSKWNEERGYELLREARPYLDKTNWGMPGGDLCDRIDAAIKGNT
jgi:hypothetical protein